MLLDMGPAFLGDSVQVGGRDKESIHNYTSWYKQVRKRPEENTEDAVAELGGQRSDI